jgi:hypothetical protein
MSSTGTASVPEVFYCLFLATNAPMGQTWLLSTHIPLSEAALHHLALELKVPLISKAREDAYGHFCAASHMNKVLGQYWQPKPDLMASLAQASQLLNPQPAPSTPMARLTSLCLEAVGGILLVTQQCTPDGTSLDPYITVVAAPALALLVWRMLQPHRGILTQISGMIRFYNHLVSQPTQSSTAHSWQQHQRAYLASK